MKGLIKNEILLFFSRKNKIVWLLGTAVVVLIFYFYYVPQYENYPQVMMAELSENAKDIAIWTAEYQYECTALSQRKDAEQTSQELARAELLLELWKDYEQANIRLMYYWSDEPDENGIRMALTGMDDELTAIREIGKEVEATNIFRGTFEDWEKRMLLHKAYRAAKVDEPICPIVPQGLYLMKDAFSGSSLVFLTFIVMIILFHFDSWAAEFENHTYYRLCTLPVKKGQLYVVRFLVRAACNIFCIGITACILFLLGTVRYGAGTDILLAVSADGAYAAAPIMWAAEKEILGTLLYHGFLTAAVLAVSFLVKTKMNTLMLCAVVCMAGVVQVTSPKLTDVDMTLADRMNPFELLRMEEIVMGEIEMGIQYLLLPLVYIILLLVMGSMIICVREE